MKLSYIFYRNCDHCFIFVHCSLFNFCSFSSCDFKSILHCDLCKLKESAVKSDNPHFSSSNELILFMPALAKLSSSKFSYGVQRQSHERLCLLEICNNPDEISYRRLHYLTVDCVFFQPAYLNVFNISV